MIRVAGLHIYPVKSLRGFAVRSAEVDAIGLAGDRRFLVVDENGRFLTQRTQPKMALVSTALSNGLLHLTAEGLGTIAVPTLPDPCAPIIAVSVWSQHELPAEDCGKEAARWLEEILGVPCRLVRIGPAFHRPVLRGNPNPDDHFTFADGAPLLATTTASLDELNRRILENGGSPVPMDRFRPNIVLEGSEPFAEDDWAALDIAGVRFRAAGPCKRCIVTTADQVTGQRGKEPLSTLARFRRDPLDPSATIFGLNLIHETKTGFVTIGDPAGITSI